MDASDGYAAVEEVSADGMVTLSLRHMSGNEQQTIAVLGIAKPDDTIAYGRVSRLVPLWQAIARYLNCGGNIRNLSDQIYDLSSRTSPIPEANWEDEGWYLLNTSQEVDEVQHIFFKPGTKKAFVWQEGSFVEERTLDDINGELNEQQADADSDG